MLANCNYAITLGKQMGFSLVGIAGSLHLSYFVSISFHKSLLLQLISWRRRHLEGQQDLDVGLDVAVDEGVHLVFAQEGQEGCHWRRNHCLGKRRGFSFFAFCSHYAVLGWDHIFFIKMSKIPRKVSNQEEKSGKTHTIKDFKDKEAIKTALPVLDLIDCIKPGTVDYSNVVDKPDSTDEVCLRWFFRQALSKSYWFEIHILHH